ncbi:MAG: hypothetical protein WD049_05365 [Candidatus Paceibacterota bacterium]
MRAQFFLVDYVVWHYTRAMRDGARIVRNLVWFCFHFFSIALLARTLIAPFEKLGEQYPQGFHPAKMLSTFVVNILMRVVGAIVRLVVISIGFLSMAAVLLAGVAAFVVWAIFPFATLGAGITGVLLIIGV